MIAIVASVILPLLFAGSGTLAIAVLAGSWRRHAGALARLRAELAACDAPAIAMALPATRPARTGGRRAVQPIRPAAPSRPAPGGLRAAA